MRPVVVLRTLDPWLLLNKIGAPSAQAVGVCVVHYVLTVPNGALHNLLEHISNFHLRLFLGHRNGALWTSAAPERQKSNNEWALLAIRGVKK